MSSVENNRVKGWGLSENIQGFNFKIVLLNFIKSMK